MFAKLIRRHCTEITGLLVAVVLSGCTSTKSMKRVNLEAWEDQSVQSALTGDHPSEFSTDYLRQYDLERSFRRDPMAVLCVLDQTLCAEPDREKLFVLSELCYLQGKRAGDPSEKRRLFLSSARYAYLCMFHPDAGPPLSAFDRRFQLASELYNKASAQMFWVRRDDWKERIRGQGRAPLLRGEAVIAETTNMVVQLEDLDRSALAVGYEVRGLSPHVRRQGLGLPFIGVRPEILEAVPAVVGEHPPVRVVRFFAAVSVPRFEGPICADDDAETGMQVFLESYDPVKTPRISMHGHNVPLEADFSGPLAMILDQHANLQGFLNAPSLLHGESLAGMRGLYFFQPYQPGQVPVVFVHGLLSSPITWLPMMNSLIADTEVLEKCQIWSFFYPTGNPILQTASELRQSLLAVRRQLDPAGEDPALDHMVLVGHSMGGLISRLMISTSEGEFLQNARGMQIEDLDNLGIPDEQKSLLRRAFKFEPVPGIDRVIFMATPHRGARMAETLVGGIGRSFIRFPKYLLDRLESGLEEIGMHPEELPTGIDNLRMDSNFMQSLDQLPMNPEVTFHSIIGNEKTAGVAAGTDGVVTYTSSHLDGAASESIYKSGHNVQKHPLAIQEVRKILLQHANAVEE